MLAERGDLLTFSRASTATDFGPSGLVEFPANTLRSGFDPATGAPLGWLIEGASTNYIPNSQNGLSGGGNLAAASTDIAPPFPGAIVRKHTRFPVAQQGDDNCGVTAVSNIPAASTLAGSAWVYLLPDVSYWSNTPALSIEGGGVTGNARAPIDSSIRGRWQRIAVTANSPAGSPISTNLVIRGGFTAGGVEFYSAAPQFEVGPFPTSYFPTTSGAATQAADQLSIQGARFQELFGIGAPAGFVIADVMLSQQAAASPQYVAAISDGSASNFTAIFTNVGATSIGGNTFTGGASGAAGQAGGNFALGVPGRYGLRWGGGNQAAVCFNGGALGLVTGGLPSATTLTIGNRPGGDRPLNGRIRSIAAGGYAPPDDKFRAACVLGADIAAALR